jgi:hypothetical protein
MRAQVLDNLEFRDAACQPLGIDLAFVLRGFLLLGEPLLMIERQPGGREEEHDDEAHHGQIDVQPA